MHILYSKLVQKSSDSSPPASSDLLWRIEQTGDAEAGLLMSSKLATRLDFRVRSFIGSMSKSLILWQTDSTNLNLFSVQRPGEVLTAIESGHADHMVRLTSTTEIIWVDDRVPRKPLLGYKHGRQFDRTLETHTILLNDGAHDCLACTRNLLTVLHFHSPIDLLDLPEKWHNHNI